MLNPPEMVVQTRVPAVKCHDASGARPDEQVKTIGDVRELQVFFKPGENRGGIKPRHPALIEGKNLKPLMHAATQNSSLSSIKSTQTFFLQWISFLNRLSDTPRSVGSGEFDNRTFV